MDAITLYYREGTSDKVYQACIRPKGQGFMVHFAYGRRGSTLNTGSKTSVPVEYQTAKGIYDKLIRDKRAKGYHAGSDTPVCQHPPASKTSSGIHCQLLNPVNEDHVEDLIYNNEYWMQEKLDGRRLIVKKEGGSITGINRLGLVVGLPQTLMESAANCRCDFIMDGEAIGDTLHAFDVLFINGEDLRRSRFAVRFLRLRALLNDFTHPNIHIIEAYAFLQKKERFYDFKNQGSEGVVFKHMDAPYTPGKPSEGGTQLKHKFYETASFIVAKVNTKRSVSLILFDGDKVRSAGNVTIPPNHEVPAAGTVVECRYLYAFRESGSIYQPVYLGTRDDIRAEECTIAQLKYKAAVNEQAASLAV